MTGRPLAERLAWFDQLDQAERLAIAGELLESARRGRSCWERDHATQLVTARRQVRELAEQLAHVADEIRAGA